MCSELQVLSKNTQIFSYLYYYRDLCLYTDDGLMDYDIGILTYILQRNMISCIGRYLSARAIYIYIYTIYLTPNVSATVVYLECKYDLFVKNQMIY